MKKIILQKILQPVVIAAFALLMSSATTALADTSAHQKEELARFTKYAGAPIDEFQMFSLWQTQVVGPQHVVAWTDLQNTYLIKVDKSCVRLDWAKGFSLTQNMIRKVTKSFDFVDFGHQHCKIIEIRPVDYRAMLKDGPPETKS